MYLCLHVSFVLTLLFGYVTSDPVSTNKHLLAKSTPTPNTSTVSSSKSSVAQSVITTQRASIPDSISIEYVNEESTATKKPANFVSSKRQQSQLKPFYYTGDEDSDTSSTSNSKRDIFRQQSVYFKPKRYYNLESSSSRRSPATRKNPHQSVFLLDGYVNDPPEEHTGMPYETLADSFPFPEKSTSYSSHYAYPHSEMAYDYSLLHDAEIGSLLSDIDLDTLAYSGHYQPRTSYDDSLPMDGHFKARGRKSKKWPGESDKLIGKQANAGSYGSPPNFFPVHDYTEVFFPPEIMSESLNLNKNLLIYHLFQTHKK